jgi:hypothetical protein
MDKHPARSFLSIKIALHGGRNGVGSRFRATIYHMGSGSPENDSRPLPPDSTKKYLAGCLRWAMISKIFYSYIPVYAHDPFTTLQRTMLGEPAMKCSLALIGITVATLLCFGSVGEAGTPVEPYSSKPTADEMAFVEQWKNFLLHKGDADTARYVADLPFSFQCGDRSSREWVKIETAKINSGDWQDDGTRTHTLTWKDDQAGLVCQMKMVEFHGFPAFQWTVYLRNDAQADTPKVHDFWGIDTYWNAVDSTMPILHRSIGSPGHEDDFQFRSEIMHKSMWDKRRRVAMDTPQTLLGAR